MSARMLVDLSDDRRDNKPWLPADDRDVTNRLVIAMSAWGGLGHRRYPVCVRHGFMNRVDPHRSIWRCSEFRCGVGAEIVEESS